MASAYRRPRVSVHTAPSHSVPRAERIVAWLLSAASIFVTASLVPGFVVKDFTHCAIAAIVLGLVNAVARPTLEALFVPLTAVSYAVSLFIINAVLIWFVGAVTPGVVVTGAMPAVVSSVVLTTVNTALDYMYYQPILSQ